MLIRSAVTAVLAAALGAVSPPGVSPTSAQVKVRTETIHPPNAATPPTMNQFVPPTSQPATTGSLGRRNPQESVGPAASPPGAGSEIPADPALLPAAVAQERARILAAAATGDMTALTALMRGNGTTTVFSHTQRQDPIAYWRDLYPDSGGVEVMSILIGILDTPPAHLNPGTPQEMYVWPYFARLPIAALTPAQKVELFRVVTGFDYRGMLERGRYVFYQVGIQPDGAWRYFLQSDE